MLLYTESVEFTSPVADQATAAPTVEIVPSQNVSAAPRWMDRWRNRWAQPRLELGLSLGSSAFTVTSFGQMASFPSKVAVKLAKGKALSFGREADEIEGREPEGVEVVRPISSGVVSDQKLAAKLLRAAIVRTRGRWAGTPDVALAIPSDLTLVDSANLVATVKAAGVQNVELIEQTLAAAIGAGRDLLSPEGHLVVQAGAGAVNISVVSLAGSILSRSTRTAGDAFNEAIRDHVRHEHKLLIDDRQAEQIKRELGSALPGLQVQKMTVSGRDLVEGKPSQRELSSEEIDRVLAPLLNEIGQQVRAVVAQMPIAVLADIRGRGALLCGGLAHLNRFEEFLSRETRLPFQVPTEPENVVAKGLQKVLKDHRLRLAILRTRSATTRASQELPSTRKGTGLMGALILTAGLALLTHSLPFLGQGAASQLEGYLGGLVTPSLPLVASWNAPSDAQALPPEVALRAGQQSELEAENARLRKLLKAPLFKPTRDPIAADVVARDPRGWMSTVTLNVGSEQGVALSMPVTDGTNLIGLVDRVEPHRSHVRLFTDSKSVVAARVRNTRGSGVAVGAGLERLDLRYLDPDSGVKKGDWVVTSGQDKTYPPGLKLGWVDSVRQESGQNTLTAVVRPAMNVHQIQNVLVLRK